MPQREAAALAGAGLRPQWDAWPPSVRKQALATLVTAKRPETRVRRVERVVAHLAEGTRP